MPDGHCLNILLFWRRSTAASVFRVGACFEVSLFCPPFPHSSPSLIGLLASVDVKQQKLTVYSVSPTSEDIKPHIIIIIIIIIIIVAFYGQLECVGLCFGLGKLLMIAFI